MKKFLATLGLLAVMAIPGLAQERNKVFGWCQQGGQQVVTSGISSTTRVQRSYPGCTVTVYNAGTAVLATIFSDSSGTPLANPFTANGTTGFWQWYALAGNKFDVQLSGASMTTYTIGDIWIAPTSFSGVTGSGTNNTVTKWTSASTIGNSTITDDGSLITFGVSGNTGTNNLRVTVANEGVTGTIVNRLASLTGAPSTAIRSIAGATSGVIGIVVAGAGTTGSAQIAYAGRASCSFDGATVAGQYVVPSASVAGQCSATATPAAGTAAIGLVLSTNVGAGTYEVLIFGPDTRSTSFLASSGEILWNNAGAIDGISNSVATTLGEVRFASSVRSTTGGGTKYFAVLTPQDTALTADTEAVGGQFGGFSNLSSVTRQWTAGGGTFTTQREWVFAQPTISFTSNDTITYAATVAIAGGPAAGPNATITYSYGLWVQGGYARFDGQLTAGNTLSSRMDLDATAFNGFPSTDLWLGVGNVGRARFGQENQLGGTRNIHIQGIPDTTAGYAVFEGFNAAGVILGTGGNANPILFTVNRTEVGRFETGNIFYVGNGVQVASPQTGRIRGAGGTGSNIVGGNLEFMSGLGTGNAAQSIPGIRLVKTTASGTTAQSYTNTLYRVLVPFLTMYTDSAAIANTVAETSLITGSFIGSKTLEGGTAKVGTNLRFRLNGVYDTTSTPTMRIRTKWGVTAIGDVTVTLPTVGGDTYWEVFGDMHVRAVGGAGSVVGQIHFVWHTTAGAGASAMNAGFGGAAPAVDTTVDQTIDVTATWGTADPANTITTRHASIDIIQ